jgi:deazaflavin-dependent oxidoreductase (nitroreductase family)
MPLPRRLADLNRVASNRLMRPIARHVGGFGVVVHHGRRSGSRYTTPVNLFDVPGGVVIPLVYGGRSDWALNVVAEGGCEIVRSTVPLLYDHPRLVTKDAANPSLAGPIRFTLSVLNVNDFLRLDAAP